MNQGWPVCRPDELLSRISLDRLSIPDKLESWVLHAVGFPSHCNLTWRTRGTRTWQSSVLEHTFQGESLKDVSMTHLLSTNDAQVDVSS